ncbi:DUF262 domain-containing protein [Burkholderia sp. B21-007]|uniref:DUF262 domain-containing protein n=1 Tax=Burkholderia sp. B21-007 TaxID=2890407 RepID=UPI001E45D34F|nr:DUF262 domain-containing protein [Burkholderia sp. B21-007]UEP31769.1 DUF262 domain-containing protein [Burkholderia sp. B21-007]
MKSFDSRTYSINDFVEWDAQKQLVLNPIFQRRAVWSEKAKSYLIDTILRGKPIPKVFIRQKLNVTTKSSVREVVDGQQRLRTILSYVKDGFSIAKNQHPEYGGLRFSQLPADIQEQLLSFEIAVDLLINLPDAEILDIFARLNSYAVVLNEQEKINSSHFGPFKVLADKIGFDYNEYWLKQKILTPQQVLRMQEINLVADIMISVIEGIKSKKQIKKYYASYESDFPHDIDDLEGRFRETIDTIARMFPEGLAESEFRRVHIFYSLFTAVYHSLFGLKNFTDNNAPVPRPPLGSEAEIEQARNGLDRVNEIFSTDDAGLLTRDERDFLQDSRRATTDEAVRARRAKFLLNIMGQ